jgi:hypothetical protein
MTLKKMVSSGRTVVELLTHNTKSEGSNPTAGTRREKVGKSLIDFEKSLSGGNTVVELLPHNPKSAGLNPTTITLREKNGKIVPLTLK